MKKSQTSKVENQRSKGKRRLNSSDNDVAVKLTNVSKKYILHHEKPTLVENVLKSGYQDQYWALKDVNLTVHRGEKIGVIGSNGAGKTTLLKLISGITAPTEGTVETVGNVVSLIDLEAGFHPDLTGEENIRLNAMLIGMSKRQIRDKMKYIIDFADIGEFIDAPMYTYSSGMKLRLGFSIVVYSDPDILILDEMLSVGDTDFRKKSFNKMQEFFKEGKTIVLVSHWREFIDKNCTRVITLCKGICG